MGIILSFLISVESFFEILGASVHGGELGVIPSSHTCYYVFVL